jgi:hypothetical protein
VFLSSTFADLQGVRRAVSALLAHAGFRVIKMEDLAFAPAYADLWSSVKVIESDAIVALIGPRYGSLTGPLESMLSWPSIVEAELGTAATYRIPAFVYEIGDALVEDGEPRNRGREWMYNGAMRGILLMKFKPRARLESIHDLLRIERDLSRVRWWLTLRRAVFFWRRMSARRWAHRLKLDPFAPRPDTEFKKLTRERPG